MWFINDYIVIEYGDMVMFVILFFGVIDISNGNLSYINVGYELVFILNFEGIKYRLKFIGFVVGMMFNFIFIIDSLKIDFGEMLIGYIDGVIDVRLLIKEFFGC